MSEIQAIIQEFKDALHFAPLPYLVWSEFYSPTCTHEDMDMGEGGKHTEQLQLAM